MHCFGVLRYSGVLKLKLDLLLTDFLLLSWGPKHKTLQKSRNRTTKKVKERKKVGITRGQKHYRTFVLQGLYN